MRNDYEQLLEDFYSAVIRPGAVCVDAGAHMGRHAIPMALCAGNKGTVWAFEPIPSCAAHLRSLSLRKDSAGIIVNEVALGDTPGRSTFVFVKNLPEYSGLKERVYDQAVEKEIIEVAIHKLDGYADRMGRVDYIKIDAEGGELGILKGATAILTTFHPTISFEFGMNSSRNYGIEPVDMFNHLDNLGYAIMDILGRPLDRAEFDTSAKVQQVWDYIAVPSEDFDYNKRILANNAQ